MLKGTLAEVDTGRDVLVFWYHSCPVTASREIQCPTYHQASQSLELCVSDLWTIASIHVEQRYVRLLTVEQRYVRLLTVEQRYVRLLTVEQRYVRLLTESVHCACGVWGSSVCGVAATARLKNTEVSLKKRIKRFPDGRETVTLRVTARLVLK